ncbi:hypothetical protein CAPTEDRAFT_202011 [Capitella teleta]|uniref:Uncharacterized protein n=1 Tax=Capitella teleta TaxID=283909 RepID=R7T8U2_CAPTE|nr:hypothetical protein CAPTEDRAFT_202011 [Capitella teleta]|eukprot:ELT89838.1 hypothetical protein CAPTEDRAFT_202011 [Capitella teleta]
MVHITLSYSYTSFSDAGNKKIKIFSALGKLKVECSIPKNYAYGLVEPSGVAVLDTGEIVTCDRRAGNLKVFTAEGKCLTTLARSLVRPCGLAITSTSALVVSDEGKKDVVIFKSISDRKPVSLQRLNPRQLDLQTPFAVCVTSNDQIVVLDIGLKKFLLFSKEGILCSDNLIPKDVLGHLVKSDLVKPVSLYQGLSMCKGPDGSILIGNCALGSILQFDVTQRKLCRQVFANSIVSAKPCAVATDDDGFLGVIEEDRQTLKIFRYRH